MPHFAAHFCYNECMALIQRMLRMHTNARHIYGKTVPVLQIPPKYEDMKRREESKSVLFVTLCSVAYMPVCRCG